MEKQKEIPVGVIVRKSPNKSPWLKWSWKPICLLPGSVDKDWKLIREESGIFDFHVGSQILELHRAEVESYKVSLAMEPASAFVIMERDELENEDKEYKLHKVTASAYEAQDYSDSDEYLVEPVPMPQTLQALIETFSEIKGFGHVKLRNFNNFENQYKQRIKEFKQSSKKIDLAAE